MAKRTLVDIVAGLDDDEVKTLVEESRRQRKGGKLRSIVFDVPDEKGGDEDEGDEDEGGGVLDSLFGGGGRRAK